MYTSQYYTNPEIDERLLQGYYDDAVAAGFTGSKADFHQVIIKARNISDGVSDIDSLHSVTDLGTYLYTGSGWKGLVNVNFDASSNVSQVALSSSTPSYENNSLIWISGKPCVMVRTYTNGAWSTWSKAWADVVNDLVTGGTDKALSAEQGKVINQRVANLWREMSKAALCETQIGPTSDLDISDMHGNVLMRLEGGHVKTKNFNSSSVIHNIEDINERVEELEGEVEGVSVRDTTKADFNIGDNNGNILLQVKNGHVKTKNFDSSNIQNNNKLQGKTFSILGDSISTYQGYLVSDESGYDGSTYAYYYPRYGVDNVSKTWWKKLEALSGMQLLHNCAWSGSQVAGTSTSTTSASVGCSDRRIADLGRNNTTPDIILILIGVNDLRNRDYHLLGDWTANDELPAEGSVTTFSAAYALMVSKVLTAYPTSEVYCCTILDTGNSGWDTQDATKYPCKNDGDNTTYQWNEKIKEVANGLGANILDMHSCGINYFNLDRYTGDRLHPNADGTTLMAKKAYSELLNKTKL